MAQPWTRNELLNKSLVRMMKQFTLRISGHKGVRVQGPDTSAGKQWLPTSVCGESLMLVAGVTSAGVVIKFSACE